MNSLPSLASGHSTVTSSTSVASTASLRRARAASSIGRYRAVSVRLSGLSRSGRMRPRIR